MAGDDERPNSRDALLDAAERLFSSRNYDAVSTRELADEAGVNLGTIQYHFGSKAKLFTEAVHRLMRRNADCSFANATLAEPPASRADAARKLCAFIAAFLDQLVRPSGPQPCRIMLREVLSDSPARSADMFDQLVESTVREFIRPIDELLLGVLEKLAPERSRAELEWCSNSIIGQCFFYVSNRPFIEGLRGIDLSSQRTFVRAAEHVARFSMRALGVAEDLQQQACREAFGA